MIRHFLTRATRDRDTAVARTLLRRSTVRIGRTIPGNRRTRIVLTLLTRTTVRIRSTTARLRDTLMILRLLTHRRTCHSNTRITHTFFIGSTGRVVRTVPRNRGTRITHTRIPRRTPGIIGTPARYRCARSSGTPLSGFTSDLFTRIRRVTPANPVGNLRPRTAALFTRRTGLARARRPITLFAGFTADILTLVFGMTGAGPVGHLPRRTTTGFSVAAGSAVISGALIACGTMSIACTVDARACMPGF